MNKLFTKIVGGIIGLTMAIGVGVAIGNNTKMKVAKATSATINLVDQTDYDWSGWGTSYAERSISHAAGTITFTDVAKPGATSDITDRPITKGGTISLVADDDYYITSFSVSFKQWTNKKQTATIYYSTNGGTSYTTTGNKGSVTADTTNETFSATASTLPDKTDAVQIQYTNNSNQTGVSSISFSYEERPADAKTITTTASTNVELPTTGSNSTVATIAYANLDSELTATSGNNSIATAALASPVASGSGNVNLTITAAGAGSTTVTLASTGAESLVFNVKVYVIEEFTKLTSTAKIKDGGKVVIVSNSYAKAISTTQNSNNRSDVDVNEATSTTAVTDHYGLATFTINKVDGYYTFYDPASDGYLYGVGTSNYLRTSKPNPLSDYHYWSISITDGVAEISCKGNSYVIQHNNGSHLFSTYSSASQTDVCLYELTSDVPVDVSLTGISDLAVDDVQVGDSVTLTASYTPTNATELFVATMSVNGKVTLGSVSMNNGSLSLSVTGVAAGEVTITLTGAESTSITDSIALTVTAYSKTHDIITDDSSLFNGQKVILGNGTAKRANSSHNGGDNLPSAEIPFANDGLSLSNASGNATEYTIWNLTIKDSEENDVNGWAFYANGYFLTCTTSTSSNYLRRTLTLSSLCLFDIDISTAEEVTTCSIVCADTHVTKNTLKFNSTNKIFSCYANGQDAVQLYSNQTSSDANIVAGYERAFLKMGDISIEAQGTGLCKTNKYYQYAKDVYVNVLTSTQKSALSANAKNRLAAWADYNDEEFNVETGLFSSKGNLVIGGSNNNTSTTIVIISILTISLAGGYFLFKKKKQ